MKIKKFLQDFKAFISRGNVVDMAVGVIMGGAFGKIVSSLVDDVIMPLISLVIGGLNVSDWKWVIQAADDKHAETALMFGNFLQNVIDFLIISFCIFLMMKLLFGLQNKLHHKKEEEPAPEPVKETELDVLTDIRNMLREQGKALPEPAADKKE